MYPPSTIYITFDCLLIFTSHNFTDIKTSSAMLQLFLCYLALSFSPVKPDPDPLQDHCVADTNNPQSVFTNGEPCIDPDMADVSHFTTTVLRKSGKTSANPLGFNITLTTTTNLPGVNTMGLTLARIDLDGSGLVPLHSHPRASEVTTCLEGTILVGFVNTSNHLYSQQLRPGDSFVFPKGLIHLLYNLDQRKPAMALSGLNSQNPGAQLTAIASFASKPSIPDEVLKKAFQISGQDVSRIRKNLGG